MPRSRNEQPPAAVRIAPEAPVDAEAIGRAVEIVYEREDGELYRHSFESDAIVAVAPGLLVVAAEEIGLTLDRMIEG